MKITTQKLIQTIEEISDKINFLQNEMQLKEQEIKDLQEKNDKLINSNHTTLSQIKDYIKELEVIRSHYANNKN